MTGRFIAIVLPLLSLLIAAPALAQTTPAPASAAKAGVIGNIIEVEGSVTVTPDTQSGEEASASAVAGMPLHMNDIVETAVGSRAFIKFIDNTQLTLSEYTNVRIDNYVFNPDPDNNKDNKAAYSVILGAFRYVSGLIGKRENPDVHIDTPVGSIGIRGTDFWAGKTLDQYGVAVYSVAVTEGQVALKTDGGSVLIRHGQGTSVKDRSSKPAARAWSRNEFEHISATVKLHGTFPEDAYTKSRNAEEERENRQHEQENKQQEQNNGAASDSESPLKGLWNKLTGSSSGPTDHHGTAPDTTPEASPAPAVPAPVPKDAPKTGRPDGAMTDQQLQEAVHQYQKKLGLPEGPVTPEKLEEIKALMQKLGQQSGQSPGAGDAHITDQQLQTAVHQYEKQQGLPEGSVPPEKIEEIRSMLQRLDQQPGQPPADGQ